MGYNDFSETLDNEPLYVFSKAVEIQDTSLKYYEDFREYSIDEDIYLRKQHSTSNRYVFLQEIAYVENFFSEIADEDLEISDETLFRSTQFVMDTADQADLLGIEIPIPVVAPAGRDSIEIFWQTLKMTLLVNIPADGNNFVSFYGINNRSEIYQGNFRNNCGQYSFASWINQ
jgi:hypothetical protein